MLAIKCIKSRLFFRKIDQWLTGECIEKRVHASNVTNNSERITCNLFGNWLIKVINRIGMSLINRCNQWFAHWLDLFDLIEPRFFIFSVNLLYNIFLLSALCYIHFIQMILVQAIPHARFKVFLCLLFT